MLVITAHDKFQQIIDEANKPDSLLKRGNIIYAEDAEATESVSVKYIDVNYYLDRIMVIFYR